MDLSYVKKLVKLLSESEIDEIEIEEEGKKVRVARHARNSSAGSQNGAIQTVTIPAPTPEQAAFPQVSPPPSAAPPESAKYHEIKSPIVGTFYKAPAPDAAPFVDVGTLIQPGVVLCIVEAMKLMNEIEADVSGRIVKVMAENGQPVEYGQTLFLVDKS